MKHVSIALIAAITLSACQSMTATTNTTPTDQPAKSVMKKDKADMPKGKPSMNKNDKSHHLDRQTKKGQRMTTKSYASIYDFNTTKAKITDALTQKGMTVFGVIDHQEAAAKAGIAMQPAVVIIFGAPKVGTPLMIKDPKFALQLPLKVLITEVDGKVVAVMNDTRQMIAHSAITWQDVENSLAKAEVLIENTVTK